MDEAKIFTYEEALATFPEVQALTEAAVQQVEGLLQGVQSREVMEQQPSDLQSAYREIVEKWAEDVTALGCVVKGLWLVDWDNGGGYYCWKYPEESLSHFHTYEDGFTGRMPIA